MKDDIKRFNDICNKYNMTKDQMWEFSDYIHGHKQSGYMGSAKKGDFTFRELDTLARDFLGVADA